MMKRPVKFIRSGFFPLMAFSVAVLAAGCLSCTKEDVTHDPPDNGGTMTDQEGNVYNTVTIGTQTWMAQNLRATKYNDGTSIPRVTDGNAWMATITAACCTYNNTTDAGKILTYGMLYNWYAVNTGKLAPKGWHVPTRDEWNTLINYAGGANAGALKLKETGTTHWNRTTVDVTNEYGLTALPGGYRAADGSFNSIGIYGFWWSATAYSTGSVWNVSMLYDDPRIFSAHYVNGMGCSILCIKD